MDEEPDFSEMSYEDVEAYIHAWLTPQRLERKLAWTLMTIALAPEVDLGRCPDDDAFS